LFVGFDFKICEQTGSWVVLEANPMPGYDMFDKHLGGAISAALGEFLCGSRCNRELPAQSESYITLDRRHSIKLRHTGTSPDAELQPSLPEKQRQALSAGKSGPCGPRPADPAVNGQADLVSDSATRQGESDRSNALMRPSYGEIAEVVRSLALSKQESLLQVVLAAYWSKGFRPAQALCDLAIAAAKDGDWKTVEELMNPDWIAKCRLVYPAISNEALTSEILSDPRLGPSPFTNATKGGGRRLSGLQHSQSRSYRDLFEAIAEEVRGYSQRFKENVCHPVSLFRPRRWKLYSWALVLDGSGFEDWHIHPGGWLSGVYYIAVPKLQEPLASNRNIAGPPGSIEFGLFPPYTNPDRGSARSCLPESGQLLLFPSYFCHRTWPSNAPTNGICISFDLVPEYT
jgi:hypothetical protein